MSVGGSLHRLAEYSHWVWSVLVLLVPLITLGTAILMVSRLRYAHVFNQLVRGRRGRRQILQIVFSLVLVFVVQEIAVPVLFCYFAFASPVRALWDKYRRTRTPQVAATDSEAA